MCNFTVRLASHQHCVTEYYIKEMCKTNDAGMCFNLNSALKKIGTVELFMRMPYFDMSCAMWCLIQARAVLIENA